MNEIKSSTTAAHEHGFNFRICESPQEAWFQHRCHDAVVHRTKNQKNDPYQRTNGDSQSFKKKNKIAICHTQSGSASLLCKTQRIIIFSPSFVLTENALFLFGRCPFKTPLKRHGTHQMRDSSNPSLVFVVNKKNPVRVQQMERIQALLQAKLFLLVLQQWCHSPSLLHPSFFLSSKRDHPSLSLSLSLPIYLSYLSCNLSQKHVEFETG